MEQRDRYGRLLAYAYLPDGRMVNALLAEGGYARQLTIPPNVRYADLIGALVADARSAGRGLWNEQFLLAEPLPDPSPVLPAATPEHHGVFTPDAAGNCVQDGKEYVKGNSNSIVAARAV